MRIKTTFYTREFIGNGEYKHTPHCKGEIFGKNIWISQSDSLPETGSKILNIVYLYNETYSRVSNGLVNTHFNYLVNLSGEEPKHSKTRLYAYLTVWQRYKLRVMMEEAEWQKNPIQFLILLVMAFTFLITTIFSVVNYVNSPRQNLQKIEENLKDIEQAIKATKEIHLDNHLYIISDSLKKEIPIESDTLEKK